MWGSARGAEGRGMAGVGGGERRSRYGDVGKIWESMGDGVGRVKRKGVGGGAVWGEVRKDGGVEMCGEIKGR